MVSPGDVYWNMGTVSNGSTVVLCWTRLTQSNSGRTNNTLFVFRYLALVIANPTHVGALTPDPRKVEIYSYVPADVSSGVCVSLKCLDGETWINTAFPMGMRVLMKHIRAGRLTPPGVKLFLT